jgi:hypothetical protein
MPVDWPSLERTYTSSTPRILSSRKNTSSLITNRYTRVLPEPLYLLLHQSTISANPSAKSKSYLTCCRTSLLFHQRIVRKLHMCNLICQVHIGGTRCRYGCRSLLVESENAPTHMVSHHRHLSNCRNVLTVSSVARIDNASRGLHMKVR